MRDQFIVCLEIKGVDINDGSGQSEVEGTEVSLCRSKKVAT